MSLAPLRLLLLHDGAVPTSSGTSAGCGTYPYPKAADSARMKDLVKPKHTWNKLEGKCVELDPRCYRNSETAGTCIADWGYIL